MTTTATQLADQLEIELGDPAWSGDTATQAAAELRRLDAEVEALRKDAERYQWLRATLHQSVGGGVEVNDQRLVYEDPEPDEAVRVFWYPFTPVGFNQSTADTLDAAIDAAMKGAANG